MEVKILAALVSALIGAGCGFLAKSYFTRLEFKQGMTEAVVTRYLDARDKLNINQYFTEENLTSLNLFKPKNTKNNT